ncbi:unnamed protein product [Nezara viridula]|uniref:CHK kinase-like domain-containing protein n=1 Tax=Nezara viridula TaxID=85310 RepID=A0A9P0HC40_NEZVI|nr:unnamed protein product [Nezara viridula]
MESKQLEVVLKRWGKGSKIDKVLSITSEAAVPKGENYLSVITRLKLKVVLGNGRISRKNLIVKETLKDESVAQLLQEMGTFKIETMMYSLILKEFEHLMDHFGDTDDVMWGQMYYAEPFSYMIFEDLTEKGFRLAKRQTPFDLEHASLVLWNLGRFHGMSKILEQKGVFSRSDFKPCSYTVNKQVQECFFYHGLRALSKAMEDSWGSSWHTIAQHIKMPLDTIRKRMAELGTIDDTKFNTLNHGDCWCSNILFKYDWKKRPVSLRFIDFQESHYGTPGWDIHFFLSMSVDANVRRNHLEDLLETYTNSLTSTLKFYNYDGKIPTLKDIKEDMDRLALFGFVILGVIHPCVTCEEQYTIDLDTIIGSNGSEGYDMEIFRSHKIRDRIGPDVINAVEKGIL